MVLEATEAVQMARYTGGRSGLQGDAPPSGLLTSLRLARLSEDGGLFTALA